MNKFEIGQAVQTRGIAEECKNDEKFAKEIEEAFKKYIQCDWGDTCESDSEMNNNAVENNNDRIVAKYITSKGDVFIITEWDRSYTTIMFSYEY